MFEKKDRSKGQKRCPICRRLYTEGAELPREYSVTQSADAAEDAPGDMMCRECFRMGYKLEYKAASFDSDAARRSVFRPAPILEGGKRPECGYDLPIPQAMPSAVLHDLVIWALLCAMMLISSYIMRSDTHDILMPAAKIVVCLGSALMFLRNIRWLAKGLFCGMGHKRRIVLLISAILLFAAVVLCSPKEAIGAAADAVKQYIK